MTVWELEAVSLGQQPLVACTTELLGHDEWSAAVSQVCRAEALTMLLRGASVPLEDGPLQVIIGHEVCNRQLLRCLLGLPRQQWDLVHRPLGARPPTRFSRFLEEVHKRLWVFLLTHLRQGYGGRWVLCQHWPPAKQAPVDPPVLFLALNQQAEAILLLQLEVNQRLMLYLMETGERLNELRK